MFHQFQSFLHRVRSILQAVNYNIERAHLNGRDLFICLSSILKKVLERMEGPSYIQSALHMNWLYLQ